MSGDRPHRYNELGATCIPFSVMQDYWEGKLSASEEQTVEHHLVDCPLCAHAFRSYHSSQNTQQVQHKVSQLTSEVREQCGSPATSPVSSNIKKSIASVMILLLLGGVGYLLWLLLPPINISPSTEQSHPPSQDTTMVYQNTFQQNFYDSLFSLKHITLTKKDTSSQRPGIRPPSFDEVLAASADTTTVPSDTIQPPLDTPVSKIAETDTTLPTDTGDRVSNVAQDTQKTPLDTITKAKDTIAPVQPARFPGGQKALQQYLQTYTQPPDTLSGDTIASIQVQITITKRGVIRNPQVVSGNNKKLKQEALRLIRTMPAWKPARQEGKAIQSDTVLTIPFQPLKE